MQNSNQFFLVQNWNLWIDRSHKHDMSVHSEGSEILLPRRTEICAILFHFRTFDEEKWLSCSLNETKFNRRRSIQK